MTKELEMHEQEDGLWISVPAPYDGSFEGAFYVKGKLVWSIRPNRWMAAGDVITVSFLAEPQTVRTGHPTKGDWVVRRMREIDPEAFADARSIIEVPRDMWERRGNALERALKEAES